MTLLLELGQLGEHNHMAEMDVGGGWIDAQLDPERLASGELLLERTLGQDLLGPAPQHLQVSHAWGRQPRRPF
jgi:hypothetical protein